MSKLPLVILPLIIFTVREINSLKHSKNSIKYFWSERTLELKLKSYGTWILKKFIKYYRDISRVSTIHNSHERLVRDYCEEMIKNVKFYLIS